VSLRSRLAREDGISLAVAVCSLALMLSLSAVGLSEAVSALRHSRHQAAVKRALQAADAAVDAAAFRVARGELVNSINIDPLHPQSVAAQNCVVSVGDTAGNIDLTPLDPATVADPNGRKWCPATTAESADSSSTFQYRLSQVLRVGTGACGQGNQLSLDREIVAVGRSGGEVRRVKARMRANLALLSGAAVQAASATQPLTMRDTARVLGNVHANGSITGFATNVIGGNATPGPGGTVSGVTPAGATTAACEPLLLPEVAQGNAPTVNDNAARTDGCVDLVTGLGIACKPLLTTTGGVDYTAATRTLRVWGNGRTVLNGSTYSLCSLRLENSGILVVKSSTPVTRIFLDDPNSCRDGSGNLLPNAGQITMDGQSRIVNCHLQTQPESLQLYAVGNKTLPTTQTLQGGSVIGGTVRAALCGAGVPLVGDPMVVYAPKSTIELGGSTAIAGQVMGNVVHMSGAAAVQPVNALVNLNALGSNPVLPLFKPTDYVECTARSFSQLPANDPAQGC
jgi:Tfp pilus assembly protein PilX